MRRPLLVLAIGAAIFSRGAGSAVAGSAARREGARAEPAGSGEIEQLAAGADRLFAIRDGTVLTFDATGSLIGRCGRLGGAPARMPRRSSRLLERTEWLADLGLPDDDSTLDAEEALDDDSGLRRRAATPDDVPVRPRALAAAGGRAWAATSDGLYQVAPEGCRRAAMAGRDLLAVAAGEGTVVAASANRLFQAEVPEATAGGGAWRFHPVAALTAPPRALAVDATGAVLVATDDGLTRLDGAGRETRLLGRPARGLAACGATVAVVAADGLYTWDGSQLARAGDAPPAQLLACGPGPRRWLAGGAGLWTSRDATSWTAHQAALGAAITALAVLGSRAWIAADDGLASVSLDDDGFQLAPAPGRVGGPPATTDDRPPAPRAPAAAPSWVWPEIGTLVTADRTATRTTVTAFLLVRFPFDRPPPPRGDRAALALQVARRDAALAQAQLAAAFGATSAAEAVDRDELAARRDMAAEAREALR